MFQCFRRPNIQVMYWLVEISNIAMKNFFGGGGGGGGKGWGRGLSTKFYTGRLHPEVQPFTPLHTILKKLPLSCIF